VKAAIAFAAIAAAAGLVALLSGLPGAAPAIGGAIAFGAAVGAAWAGLSFARSLRDVTRAASALASGDLAARAPERGGAAVAGLARALNQAADERARAAVALGGERDLYAGILDGMGEGVLVIDADERIVLANRALRDLARLGDDARTKPLIEAIRSAALKEAFDDAKRSAEPAVREIELGRPLPRKLLVRVSRLPSGGDGHGAIAVFHDVTDLRRLETIRTDFVANVSHELRTPVTAISTATETLLGGALADPEEAAEFVAVIDRHAKRLRQLVDDLLDLAKIEAKSFRLAPSDLPLYPILEHAIDLSQAQARRRRVSIRIAPGAEGVRARIDRRALEQVVMNLLDNAIKYAGEGAHVTVTARSAGDRTEIAVADDGVGISPAHLGRLFERFYRVDAGRSREMGGTGLGLSIVKHLVELMGGTVDVESEPGKGACFTLRLQAAASPSTPGAA
jgi:two-component system phosphate regulon sensor histidine kinase PhoR